MVIPKGRGGYHMVANLRGISPLCEPVPALVANIGENGAAVS